MITFRCCSDVDDIVIFETFREGFSDYYIKSEMTQDFFIEHFFGAEGNTRDLSFVAYKGEEAVGILLAGVRLLDGLKTLRCGGMAVIPKGRKKGVAKAMMQEHERMARVENVHQLFLEVLTVNQAAYNFYEQLGYEKVYDLTYRLFKPAATWKKISPESSLLSDGTFYSVQKITLTDLEALRHFDESHLPWQGSLEYVSKLPVEIFGVFKNGQLIAGLIGSSKRLFYIYVTPSHRLEGVGKALLRAFVQECEVEMCQFVYTNNARLHTFANHLGMETAEFGQYEYYKWLD